MPDESPYKVAFERLQEYNFVMGTSHYYEHEVVRACFSVPTMYLHFEEGSFQANYIRSTTHYC